VNEVEYVKDEVLKKRWKCSGMKLWRMRKAGKLHSIQLGGCGPYLTSDAEIARIEEAPPDTKQRPAPKVAAEGNGSVNTSAGSQSKSTIALEPVDTQPRINGGA